MTQHFLKCYTKLHLKKVVKTEVSDLTGNEEDDTLIGRERRTPCITRDQRACWQHAAPMERLEAHPANPPGFTQLSQPGRQHLHNGLHFTKHLHSLFLVRNHNPTARCAKQSLESHASLIRASQGALVVKPPCQRGRLKRRRFDP